MFGYLGRRGPWEGIGTHPTCKDKPKTVMIPLSLSVTYFSSPNHQVCTPLPPHKEKNKTKKDPNV